MFFVIVFGVGIAAGVIIAVGISYYKHVVLSEPTEDKTSTNSTTRPSPSGTSKSPKPNATEQNSAEIITPRQLELTIEPIPVIELRRTHERQEVPRENTRRDSDDSAQPSPRQLNPAVDPIISPKHTIRRVVPKLVFRFRYQSTMYLYLVNFFQVQSTVQAKL